MANALIEMGQVEKAIVVHGAGLDEISPLGSSRVIEIRNINKDLKGEEEEEEG